MSLVFALLREDHIIVAADSRHTRGSRTGYYKVDDSFKTEVILDGRAIFGLAGVKAGESIFSSVKQSGGFAKGTMREVADNLRSYARTKYRELVPQDWWNSRPVQFLMAGFETDYADRPVAKAYSFCSPDFGSFEVTYPERPFEVIGRGYHGALYGLHRFDSAARSVDAGLRLSCFVMHEICACDITVGGKSKLYVLRPNQPAEEQPEQSIDSSWVDELGKRIEQEIVSPKRPELTQIDSKRDPSTPSPSRE